MKEGQKLEERFRQFAINIALFINSLPKTQSNLIYGNQILRSSSSIGANYAEALYAHSKQDFTHCLVICRKETNETIHWLLLLKSTNLNNAKLNTLIDEANQILKILVSSVKTLRTNSKVLK